MPTNVANCHIKLTRTSFRSSEEFAARTRLTLLECKTKCQVDFTVRLNSTCNPLVWILLFYLTFFYWPLAKKPYRFMIRDVLFLVAWAPWGSPHKQAERPFGSLHL